ncbi:MAG: endonuclease domain-containing protein [Patescibacteria group bacterium]|nr:endonuclease domain-containing protein [Patescibacteria group bacterium]
MPTYNSKLKTTARNLRKAMTPAEMTLWIRLRHKQVYGAQFFRQTRIGNYIVDFYCPSKKLVVEVDGGHHNYDKLQRTRDEERNKYLEYVWKLRVLRFSNGDVLKSPDEVVNKIAEAIGD